MEMHWAQRWGVLLMLFAGHQHGGDSAFQGEVEDQRGAYATGVLVLIACAAVATVIDKRRVYHKAPDKGWAIVHYVNVGYYALIAMVFVATMLAVAVAVRRAGLAISLSFIVAHPGDVDRVARLRADELRTDRFRVQGRAVEVHVGHPAAWRISDSGAGASGQKLTTKKKSGSARNINWRRTQTSCSWKCASKIRAISFKR